MYSCARFTCARFSTGQMRGYAAAGLAGIMLEDQVSPKKCGHTGGKDVVSCEEAVGRLRAAVRARERMRSEQKGDLVIIARTDAAGPLGMDEVSITLIT